MTYTSGNILAALASVGLASAQYFHPMEGISVDEYRNDVDGPGKGLKLGNLLTPKIPEHYGLEFGDTKKTVAEEYCSIHCKSFHRSIYAI